MFRPRKHLGQHFLVDPNTGRKIVGALQAAPDQPVLEIGPGTGALTGLLDERFATVSAVEIDPRAAELLRSRFPAVHVIEGDVLAVDYKGLAGGADAQLHVIGNLPYNITSQILFSLIEARRWVDEAVVMMQYEVARRIVAEPGTREYGILSVALRLACRADFLFAVSRNVFRPKPDVRSAVVRLDFVSGVLEVDDPDPAWTRRVVRTAFNQRRKTLRNSLSLLANEAGRSVPDSYAGQRAEQLAPEDFVRLARYLQSG
jgi:16S rRNA (adenine1518-N6/adenine1519-N6)-dimethyltransferase